MNDFNPMNELNNCLEGVVNASEDIKDISKYCCFDKKNYVAGCSSCNGKRLIFPIDQAYKYLETERTRITLGLHTSEGFDYRICPEQRWYIKEVACMKVPDGYTAVFLYEYELSKLLENDTYYGPYKNFSRAKINAEKMYRSDIKSLARRLKKFRNVKKKALK